MVKLHKRLGEFRKNLSKNPLKAFCIVLVTLVLIYFIISLRIYLLSSVSHYLTYIFLDFLITMVIYAFYSFYLIPFVFQLPDGKQSFSEFLEKVKLERKGLSIKNIFEGFLTGIMLLVSFVLVDISLGDQFVFRLDFNRILGFPNFANLGFFNLIQQISPAFWEELIFRGIILTILLKMFSTRIAILIDTILFGVVHLSNLNPTIFDSIGQLIYTFSFGIILAYLFIKTSSLIPCIIAHYINNILSALVSASSMNLTVFFYFICILTFFTVILRLGIIKLFERLDLLKDGKIQVSNRL
jgi:membrane protease YdiL (CAAX protease family)